MEPMMNSAINTRLHTHTFTHHTRLQTHTFHEMSKSPHEQKTDEFDVRKTEYNTVTPGLPIVAKIIVVITVLQRKFVKFVIQNVHY